MSVCHQLQSYLDRGLSKDVCLEFEQHAASCLGCTRALKAWSSFESFASSVGTAEAQSLSSDDNDLASFMQKTGATRLSPQKDNSRLGLYAGLSLAVAASLTVLLYLGLFADAEPSIVVAVEQLPVSKIPKASLSWQTGPLGATHQIAEHRVTLAAKSAVEVFDQGPQFRLAVQGGEALFSVSPLNEKQLFEVKSRHLTVAVVGTRFAVTNQGDNVAVSVLEGEVSARCQDDQEWNIKGGEFLTVDPKCNAEQELLPRERIGELNELLNKFPNKSGTTDNLRSSPLVKRGSRGSLHNGEPELQHRDKRDDPVKPGQTFDLPTIKRQVADGEIASAKATLEARLRQVPTDWSAAFLLADCQRKEALYDGAVATLRGIVDSNAPGGLKNKARYRAGVVLQGQKEYGRAAALFDDYVANTPSGRLRADAQIHLSECLYAMGDKAKAVTILNQVVEDYANLSAGLVAQKMLKLWQNKE